MKKLFKSLMLSILLSGASAGIIYFIKSNSLTSNEPKQIKNELIATITGAVENPGDYIFEKDQTIREIIFKAKIKVSADIYLLGLNVKQTESFEIIVPYKIGLKPKLKYSDIETVNQLKAIGIKETIAKVLIKYKKENRGMTTWKDIDKLPGIGEKTLLFLKENIELL